MSVIIIKESVRDQMNGHNTIGSLLKNRILILSGKKKRDEVFQALFQLLGKVEGMIPKDDLEWGVMHREEILDTCMGNGIAVPHIREENIPGCAIALAIVPEGIPDYPTPDMQPVRVVFMIAAGGPKRANHLEIISKIGTLFNDGRLKAAFLACRDAKSCSDILARAEA